MMDSVVAAAHGATACPPAQAGGFRIATGAGGFSPLSGVMSRSFYILAGTLVSFALVSAGLALAPSSLQPGLPANASLWRTVAMFLLLFGLASRSEEHRVGKEGRS